MTQLNYTGTPREQHKKESAQLEAALSINTLTPSQVDNYVDTNLTTLPQIREALKLLLHHYLSTK